MQSTLFQLHSNGFDSSDSRASQKYGWYKFLRRERWRGQYDHYENWGHQKNWREKRCGYNERAWVHPSRRLWQKATKRRTQQTDNERGALIFFMPAQNNTVHRPLFCIFKISDIFLEPLRWTDSRLCKFQTFFFQFVWMKVFTPSNHHRFAL